MADSEGVVTAIEGEYAWVAVRKASACGSCESQDTCGSGLLADAGGARTYRVLNNSRARVGDVVELSVPPGALVKAALLSYLGPLLLALAGAIAGGALGGDKVALAGVGVGLVLGVLLLRGIGRRLARGKEPILAMHVKEHVISFHRNTAP